VRRFYAFRLLATSYLYVPIFMLFQASRGLSFFESFALGAVYSAVVILAELPTGVFADRIGRRRSMLCGALAMVASCAIAIGARSFAAFAAAEALAALSMALCSGADSAYLFDLLLAQDRVHEYAQRESIASAWHLLGSAFAFAGGGLLASVDLALPYVATAIVAAAAAVVACTLPAERHIEPARDVLRGRKWSEAGFARLAGWTNQMRGAVAEVARNGRLAWLVGYSAVVFVLLRATVYVYQPYLDSRGFDSVDIGMLFAGAYVIASLVASRTHLLRRRFGDELLLWGLLAALAASFLGLAASRGPWMLALLVVQAVANGVYSPLTKPLLNAEIHDSARRASILSVESMARRAATGLFAPLVGLAGQADGMVACGAIGAGGLLLLALSSKSLTVLVGRTRLRRP
jgi:MFS family permease